MLEKFILLKNIGRFVNLSSKGDVSLRKLTLIYGENGRGKTTLCSILRSLHNNDSTPIDERKSLGYPDSIECDIRIDGNNYKFSNGSWDGQYSNFAVFDSTFVHDNIFAGDVVDHEHKKNLYRVIIGKTGVEYSRKVDELDKKIREINSTIQIEKSKLEKYIPQGISFDKFISLKPIECIESQIKKSTAELEKKQGLVNKSKSIKEKNGLTNISLPDLPTDFESILKKSLDEIDEDASEKVKKHIANKMLFPNEDWLSQGMGLLKEDSCPFCSQNIKGNEIITAYRSYFNKEYNQLKSDVSNLKKRVETSIGTSELLPVQKKTSDNLNLLEFWKEHIEKVELPEISFDDIKNAYEKLLDNCSRLADKKQANPLNAITLDENFKKHQSIVKELKEVVLKYNDSIKVLNGKIVLFKQSLPTESNIPEFKKKLHELKINKIRFEKVTVNAVESYKAVLKNKKKLETEKDSAKDELLKYCKKIPSKFENSINSYLSSFNTGFSVTNSKHSYIGGTPSSYYELKINNTSIGLDKFKTSMSAGDRSALAFAFFLSSLEYDSELNNKIVVLDDPFTSLDRFRRECTAQLSYKLSVKAKQVIILSHDPQFLKLVYDWHGSTETKTLQLSKCAHGTVIAEWDIKVEMQSTYMENYSTLLAFYCDREGDKTKAAKAIRPFIEGWLRTHFPGYFQSNEWLGKFIGKIRDADESSGLAHAKQDLEEIEAINSYSKEFHHDQNQNADRIISEEELYGFVRRTLALVGGDS